MNIQEFYDTAVLTAKELGIEKPNVTTISGCFDGTIRHSVQIWMSEKRKHLYSELHNNPNSAIQSFKDVLEFSLKEYSKKTELIEVSDDKPGNITTDLPVK